MRKTPILLALSVFGMLLGMVQVSPAYAQDSKAAGKLILFADTAVFATPANPDNCTLRNRFKHGEGVGFRLYAIDGGTNKAEESATVIVHITTGGKSYDVPAKYRGVPQKDDTGMDMPIHGGMWTAKWTVPNDAPTGTVQYSATAKDKLGRTAEWTPPGGKPSFVTIVQ